MINPLNIFKTIKIKNNFSEFGWIIAGQILSIFLAFITTKLLTQMGTIEYGKYSLVLTVASLASILIFGPAEQSFVRYYYDYLQKGVTHTYLKIFYRYICLIGIGTIITIFAASFLALNLKWEISILSIFAMGIYIFVNPCTNIFNSMLNVLRKRKQNTFLQIIEKIIIIFLLLFLILKFEINAENALLVIIIATSIVLVVKIKVLNRNVPNDKRKLSNSSLLNKKIYNVLLSFGIPFAIWGVFGWLQSTSERWVIAYYLSTSEVGIYSLMVALANYMISLPSGILNQFLQPIIYENISSNETYNRGIKIINYLIILIAALSVFMTFLTLIFGEKIIVLVSNSEFANYWFILPLVCIGFGLFQIGQAMTIVGLINNTPEKYIIPKILSGIIAVILNVIFIIKFDLIGIPFAIITTNIIFVVLIRNQNLKIEKQIKA